MVHLLFSP